VIGGELSPPPVLFLDLEKVIISHATEKLIFFITAWTKLQYFQADFKNVRLLTNMSREQKISKKLKLFGL
jgi:hypothetical protein